jgi:hypothetical protein
MQQQCNNNATTMQQQHRQVCCTNDFLPFRTLSKFVFDNIFTLHHVNAKTLALLFRSNNKAISPKKDPSLSSASNSSVWLYTPKTPLSMKYMPSGKSSYITTVSLGMYTRSSNMLNTLVAFPNATQTTQTTHKIERYNMSTTKCYPLFHTCNTCNTCNTFTIHSIHPTHEKITYRAAALGT